MKRSVRTIVTMGFLGCVTFALMPLGCGTDLAQVTVRQNGSDNRSALPAITVKRLQACVAEYGGLLEPRHYGFSPQVQVDENGVKWAITTDDIPASAADFAACTRSALSDMPVSEDLVRNGAEEMKIQRDQASAAQRSLMGSPVVIVVAGVVIVVSELVLEAGTITILFAVTVKVVEKVVDDVAELAKRKRDKQWDECLNRYEACVAGKLYREQGAHIGDSRCGLCVRICKDKKIWPAFVDLGPCQ